MDWMQLLILVVQTLVLVIAISTGFAYLTLFERRFLARFQNRVGPNRAGPWGVLQPAADAVKLFFKEDIVPSQSDRWVYLLAPALAVIPALIIWAVIPLGCWNISGDYRACFDPAMSGELHNLLQIAEINIGVLYLLAITSIGVYGITLAGWASNSKYSMLGGIRSSAQLISYELALGMAVLGAVMMADTLSTEQMVAAQAGLWTIGGLPIGIPQWIVIPQILGFAIFLISSNAELVRAPFDLVEAEQELTSGYNTEYGSMKFALFFMAEYIKMIAISAIAVTLFLGGWHFPFLFQLGEGIEGIAGTTVATAVVGVVSILAFMLKVVILLFGLVWLRATLPRVRYDQLMELGWKWLLPLALLNLIVTPVVIVLLPNMAAHTIVLFLFGAIVLFSVNALGRSRLTAPGKRVRLVQMAPTGRQGGPKG
jgi:NADH-quinone oxidoreductase subunit H